MPRPDEISLQQVIVTLKEWCGYLFGKRLILCALGILGFIAGYMYAYSKKNMYKAELTFVLEQSKPNNFGGYAGLASQFGVDMGGASGIFEGENLLALMRSRTMIEKTLLTTVDVDGEKLTLADFYIKIKHLREEWEKEDSKYKKVTFQSGINSSDFSLEQNILMKSFHNTIVAENLLIGSQDKKSNILSIVVTSENEIFSKYFAEVLIREVSNFYIDTKVTNVKRNVIALQRQIDSVRSVFNKAISGVASSSDANPNPNPNLKALQIPSQRKQVDAQANQAMLVQLMQNLAVTQNALREQTPLIQVIDRPILPLDVVSTSKTRMALVGAIFTVLLSAFCIVLLRLMNVLR